ncbi:MAG: EamA family transporter [Actinobacteria bacterium]|nr:EamA family transporter [Actinomycetota bacterium]
MKVADDPSRMKRRGYLFAILAALLWASGGLMAKWLMTPYGSETAMWLVPPTGGEIDPVVLAGSRAIVAAGILAPILLILKPSLMKVRLRDLWFLAAFGIIGLAGVHFTYFKAIDQTNVSTAILLQYLSPVIVLVLSVALLGERFRWSLPVGVAFSILGCALVVGAFAAGGLKVSDSGLFWGLTSAVFFATYSLMGRYAVSRFNPWTLMAYGLIFASIFWIVYLGGISGVVSVVASERGSISVGYLAIFATIIPFAAFLSALHYIEATKAIVTSTLEPVIAGMAAYFLFVETLTPSQLVGAAMVIIAIMVIQSGPPAVASQHSEIPPAT